jgi:molecular chaperone DnaK (HSP70)
MTHINDRVSVEAALRNGRRGNFASLASSSSESTSAIVIGIDFGTTYTGVAYAFTDSLSHSEIRINSETRNERETIVEKITVLRQWPNASQEFAEKTPTHLAYENGRVVAWGGQVVPSHTTRIAGFKLGLNSGA